MKLFELFSILSVILVLLGRTIHAGLLKKRDDDQNPFQEPQILPYSTAGCGGENNNPAFVCLIQCPYDMRCQSLGWNFTTYSCACGAEICPDGKIYTSYDYTKDTPLTDAQITKQPHVLAPCNGCVPSDVAPCHQQIGDCSTLANYTQSESGTPTCY